MTVLDDTQQALKYIPCTGHSRIWLLQMEDVAFVSSRMSGIYVTDREGKEGFTELTLRTREPNAAAALPSSVSGQHVPSQGDPL
jgi:two-component system LytT family response regulator